MRAQLNVPLPTADDPLRVVTAHEMTVGEVRAWITESSAQPWRDPITAMALSGQACEAIGLDELARMCDCAAEQLESYPPGDLVPLVDAAKALNPLFFGLRTALAQAVRNTTPNVSQPTQATDSPTSPHSTETSAPSSDLATPTF